MAGTGSPVYGAILNKGMVSDKITGDVAAATKLEIGLVYQSAGGWVNTPATGAVLGSKIYWNERVIDNTAGAKGAKTGTFYGEGSCVIGKADAAIIIGTNVMASETAGHGGQLMQLAWNITNVAGVKATLEKIVGKYIGHAGEYNTINNPCTNAADAETNCVFLLRSGI